MALPAVRFLPADFRAVFGAGRAGAVLRTDAAFRAAGFLAGTFRAADFLSGAFRPADFRVGAFRAVDFLAGAFLAASLLAGVSLEAGFLVAGALREAGFLVAGALRAAGFLPTGVSPAAFLAPLDPARCLAGPAPLVFVAPLAAPFLPLSERPGPPLDPADTPAALPRRDEPFAPRARGPVLPTPAFDISPPSSPFGKYSVVNTNGREGSVNTFGRRISGRFRRLSLGRRGPPGTSARAPEATAREGSVQRTRWPSAGPQRVVSASDAEWLPACNRTPPALKPETLQCRER